MPDDTNPGDQQDGDATSGGTDDTTPGADQQGGSDSGDDKTFTQAEVNAIAAREAAKAARGKIDPKELGFQSAKEAKDAIEAARKAADDAKDESTKALEQAKEEAAKQAREEVLSKANQRLLKASFMVQAAGKVVDAEDAFVIAQTTELWKDVELNEETGDVSGLDDKFFEDLKKAKPHLFATQQGGQDLGAGRQGGGDTDTSGELAQKYAALQRPWFAGQKG